MRTLLTRIRPPAGMAGFSLVCAVDAAGTGLFTASSVVYFQRDLGLSAQEIGLGLSLAMLVGLAAAVPAGRAGDRWGFRRVLLGTNLAAALLFAGYPLVRDLPSFLAVAALIGLVQSAQFPLRAGMVSNLSTPRTRVQRAAYVRALANTAFGLGAAAGAAALAWGGPEALQGVVLGNAVSFLGAATLLWRMRDVRTRSAGRSPDEESAPGRPSTSPGPSPERPRTATSPYRDGRFMAAAALSALLLSSDVLLTVGLPLALLAHHAPGGTIPGITVVNCVLVALLQVRLSAGVTTARQGGRALARGATLSVAAAAVLSVALTPAGRTWPLIGAAAAVLLLSTAEMLVAAGSSALLFGLADPRRQGHYLGVAGQLQQGVAVLLPAGTALVVGAGPWGWGALACCYLACAGGALLLERPAGPRAAVRTDTGAPGPVAGIGDTGAYTDAGAGADTGADTLSLDRE